MLRRSCLWLRKLLGVFKFMNHPKQKLAKSKGWMSLLVSFVTLTGTLGSPAIWVSLTPPALAQTESDREGEADRLFQQGIQQAQTSQYREAIQYWQKALEIYREIGDRNGEARSLNNLGIVYRNLGEYPKAIEYYQQSLAIKQEIGASEGTRSARSGEARSLNNLGSVYQSLGQYPKAIAYYQQSLAIKKDIGDLNGEANSLMGLGNVYKSLGEYPKAIAYYQQSLAIFQDISNRNGEANSLNNLGSVYQTLGEYPKTIAYYQQSLAIFQDISNRNGEANSLMGLGKVYKSLEEYPKAIAYYQQSLAIFQEIGAREGEGLTLSDMGSLLAQQDRPQLAIIFYKQAVNVRETIREKNRQLSPELQQSYTETIADSYRRLADLLLQQDRILEAQQVLDLLKVQELDDYLRGVRGNERTRQGVDFLQLEKEFQARYRVKLEELITIGRELTQLRKITPQQRTESQNARKIELEQRERQVVKEFLNFLRTQEVSVIVQQLKSIPESESLDPKLLRTLQDNLQQLEDSAVLLYPLILEDRLELVLVTPNNPPIRQPVPVDKQTLNRTITDFRSALEQREEGIEPLAQQLYDWLIAPFQPALAKINAQTIIYAPDGPLRYIPLAALHDGKQWLIENYRINNITALSLTDLGEKSRPLNILAGAFTQGRHLVQVGEEEREFLGLPFAGQEVDNLEKTIPGTVKLLDSKFSQTEMENRMSDYSLIHLATHAAFVVGQPKDSFILFGDGSKVTFLDVETWNLPNTDLVVLSACETGVGGAVGTADGREILGFGYLMQQAGSRAAIASLWSVNDGGTQALMDAFYAALKVGKYRKAEALRQAQIALITANSPTADRERGSSIEIEAITGGLPPGVANRLSHPNYWAPFILIGNGL